MERRARQVRTYVHISYHWPFPRRRRTEAPARPRWRPNRRRARRAERVDSVEVTRERRRSRAKSAEGRGHDRARDTDRCAACPLPESSRLPTLDFAAQRGLSSTPSMCIVPTHVHARIHTGTSIQIHVLPPRRRRSSTARVLRPYSGFNLGLHRPVPALCEKLAQSGDDVFQRTQPPRQRLVELRMGPALREPCVELAAVRHRTDRDLRVRR